MPRVPLSQVSTEAVVGTGHVLVSETFRSIQGEGKLVGVPSFFIRLSGCNLRCTWCDTPYASWKPEGQSKPVSTLVTAALQSHTRHVVVTGGEPMLFPEVDELCDGLASHGLHVTIETAGTLLRQPKCNLISISPKLSNSTPRIDPRDPGGAWAIRHEQRRLNIPVIQRLLSQYVDRQLKFVVNSSTDLAEVDHLLGELSGVAPEEVLLMPEGIAWPPANDQDWVIDACISRGWRYCSRLHIQLFGNRRGT
jgi:7-carboxy-7-deazaguanine synthase